jgi:hypothetical protein
VRNLAAGSYTLEKWDTTSLTAGSQKRSSTTFGPVTDGYNLDIAVSLGGDTDYDYAYKLYKTN